MKIIFIIALCFLVLLSVSYMIYQPPPENDMPQEDFLEIPHKNAYQPDDVAS
jgi:hypothetical protein